MDDHEDRTGTWVNQLRDHQKAKEYLNKTLVEINRGNQSAKSALLLRLGRAVVATVVSSLNNGNAATCIEDVYQIILKNIREVCANIEASDEFMFKIFCSLGMTASAQQLLDKHPEFASLPEAEGLGLEAEPLIK